MVIPPYLRTQHGDQAPNNALSQNFTEKFRVEYLRKVGAAFCHPRQDLPWPHLTECKLSQTCLRLCHHQMLMQIINSSLEIYWTVLSIGRETNITIRVATLNTLDPPLVV
jgi:hypothetical protein